MIDIYAILWAGWWLLCTGCSINMFHQMSLNKIIIIINSSNSTLEVEYNYFWPLHIFLLFLKIWPKFTRYTRPTGQSHVKIMRFSRKKSLKENQKMLL